MSDERNSVGTVMATIPDCGLATSCLVCGEGVPIRHSCDYHRICDKCKEAIMFAREIAESVKESPKIDGFGVVDALFAQRREEIGGADNE